MQLFVKNHFQHPHQTCKVCCIKRCTILCSRKLSEILQVLFCTLWRLIPFCTKQSNVTRFFVQFPYIMLLHRVLANSTILWKREFSVFAHLFMVMRKQSIDFQESADLGYENHGRALLHVCVRFSDQSKHFYLLACRRGYVNKHSHSRGCM